MTPGKNVLGVVAALALAALLSQGCTPKQSFSHGEVFSATGWSMWRMRLPSPAVRELQLVLEGTAPPIAIPIKVPDFEKPPEVVIAIRFDRQQLFYDFEFKRGFKTIGRGGSRDLTEIGIPSDYTLSIDRASDSKLRNGRLTLCWLEFTPNGDGSSKKRYALVLTWEE